MCKIANVYLGSNNYKLIGEEKINEINNEKNRVLNILDNKYEISKKSIDFLDCIVIDAYDIYNKIEKAIDESIEKTGDVNIEDEELYKEICRVFPSFEAIEEVVVKFFSTIDNLNEEYCLNPCIFIDVVSKKVTTSIGEIYRSLYDDSNINDFFNLLQQAKEQISNFLEDYNAKGNIWFKFRNRKNYEPLSICERYINKVTSMLEKSMKILKDAEEDTIDIINDIYDKLDGYSKQPLLSIMDERENELKSIEELEKEEE